jgi:hypothetical protein
VRGEVHPMVHSDCYYPYNSIHYESGRVLEMTEKIDLDEVRELLQGKSRDEILAYIKRLIPTEGKRRTSIRSEHGKPVSYTTVVKSYTCLGCGSKFTSRYNLPKNDDVIYLDPNGKAHNVKVTGKAGEVVVPCAISKCGNCACLSSVWPREELELRFLTLLRSSSFNEIAIYNLVIKEVKSSEDHFGSSIKSRCEEALRKIRCEGDECDSPYCVCRQTTFAFSATQGDNSSSQLGRGIT